jgi:hypothetical protein
MGFAAIVIGLFILFAVAFVGGLGSALYSYSACASAVSLILAGAASLKVERRVGVFWLLVLAAITYVPVIFHRFGFRWGIDWGGIVFDVLYVAFLLWFSSKQWPGRTRRRRPDVGDT